MVLALVVRSVHRSRATAERNRRLPRTRLS